MEEYAKRSYVSVHYEDKYFPKIVKDIVDKGLKV